MVGGVRRHSPIPLKGNTRRVLFPISLFLACIVLLLWFQSWIGSGALSQESVWSSYTVKQAAASVSGGGGNVIVCVVSYPYLGFLVNWLLSIAAQGHHDKVLVIAEDYQLLNYVNGLWPGHAVLIPPALPTDSDSAHRFGSQGFFNFTVRRPNHLLTLLELGYTVLYNDVDMVWLNDPFPLFVDNHDIYFTDDMTAIKPESHSHELPQPGKKGRTYICSCMIYMRPTPGAKLVLRKWIDELHQQPWSPKVKTNDQPAFNWALNKTASEVDMYLLPQVSFPSGGLYFRNETWRALYQSKQAIVHNNYITGFEKKIKRFKASGLWFLDEDHVKRFPDFKLVQHYYRTHQQEFSS